MTPAAQSANSPDVAIPAAAFRALTAGDPQAIRAESIARALKVGKGSVYWHFADVAALKQAMLEHWARTATRDVIDLVETRATDAAERLRILVQFSTTAHASHYGGPLAEAAIRDWARYDLAVAKILKGIDKKRLDFVQTQFRAHGTPPNRCKSHATILYAALIGLEHLSHHGLPSPGRDIGSLLDLLLANPPPAVSD